MRLQCGLLLGLVLLVGCTKQADTEKTGTGKADQEEIYFVRNVVRVEGSLPTSLTQSTFNATRLTRQDDGAQTMRQRTLWMRQSGGRNTSGTLEMDPEDADEKQLLALLGGGFDVSLDTDGSVKDVRAVDQQAFAALVQRRPEAAALVAPREPGTALRPLVLPDRLSVGQEFTRAQQSAGFGALSSHMRVSALSDEVALIDIEVSGNGVRGGGQQAVRRRDGTPIEMQFELVRKATGERPATSMQLSITNMAYPPAMELGGDAAMYRLNRDGAAETLANPPFSVQTDDARLYHLAPGKEGELSSWMLSPAALDGMEKGLMFALLDERNAGRPLIAMGGKMPWASSAGGTAGQLTPFVLAELRKVTLLDAAGRELPDVAPIPVHRKVMFTDQFRAMEKDIDFPFRLPLQTRAAQLARLETIRLDMGVEAYTWAGSETVKTGAQPKDNPGARIRWTGPRRLTVEQDRTPSDVHAGMWTVAVPIDAQGQQIPSAVLETSAFVDEKDPQHPQTLPPLDWVQRSLPMRQEIATLQPVAALQLRHYRWEQVPRQWTLRNARNMTPPAGQQ